MPAPPMCTDTTSLIDIYVVFVKHYISCLRNQRVLFFHILWLINYMKSSIASQLRCHYHPTEVITNFCLKGKKFHKIDECLNELCATCICIHTEMHAQKNSLPAYQNINQTIREISQLIDTQRVALEAQKNRCVFCVLIIVKLQPGLGF